MALPTARACLVQQCLDRFRSRPVSCSTISNLQSCPWESVQCSVSHSAAFQRASDDLARKQGSKAFWLEKLKLSQVNSCFSVGPLGGANFTLFCVDSHNTGICDHHYSHHGQTYLHQAAPRLVEWTSSILDAVFWQKLVNDPTCKKDRKHWTTQIT